jgi:hypothetical protein
VVHLKIGNMKMQDLYDFIDKVWDEIIALNNDHKLITVFKDRIEAIED